MIPGGDFRRRLWGATLAAVALASAAAAPSSALVGLPAPALDAAGVVVAAEGAEGTSKPLALVFSKPDDAHTKDAIAAIGSLHHLHPRLRDGSRTVLVLSRLGAGMGAPTAAPPEWRVLRDTADSLYASYGIIATPTVVVVGADGRVASVHAGYNANLAEALRRDLTVAIDGPESLGAPTPTPGIMDVQTARMLAKRRMWERSLEYYRKAAARGPLPCEIALEEVAVHLELRQAEEAVKLLDAMGEAGACGTRAGELRERARAIGESKPAGAAAPPKVP